MTGVSRRALLGYSGSAAAGAALAGAGSAGAAEADSAATAQAASATAATAATPTSDADVPNGQKFGGNVSIGDIDAMMDFSFSLRVENAPAAKQITPMEIVNAFNEIATSRGWPRMTFYYETSAPLN
ncbi:hypothetical protein ACH4D5_37575 [Streptomyces sp. NPDC018029]|uniref:hypothetical protein n=1 Tax=Streptomyces sp. NPDC018029 TaxID=3365032 RepID=UPI0037ADE64B